MKNFYCASRSISRRRCTSSWSSRLEDLQDQTKKRGKVEPDDANEMLCGQFWSGLRPELRAGTEKHKFDSITDFHKPRLWMHCLTTIQMHYVYPFRLNSDQDANFTDRVISELCKMTCIERSVTKPYHTISNGVTERFTFDRYLGSKRETWLEIPCRTVSTCLQCYQAWLY